MSTVDFAPVAQWLHDLLEQGTARPVGDGEAPVGAEFPYFVTHVSVGALFGGPALWAPDADADIGIQVDSVGRTIPQARWAADASRRTLVARVGGRFQVNRLDPEGYHVADRQTDGGPNLPIPEGTSSNRVYTISERFTLRLTAGVSQ